MTSDPESLQDKSWLDRWLEPRWRALITWLVLAAISSAVLEWGVIDPIVAMVRSGVQRMLPGTVRGLSFFLESVASSAHILPLFVWYQPLALGLKPLRWLIWIGGAVAVSASFILLRVPPGHAAVMLFLWGWPALAGVLLIDLRSRPWMSLPAGLLSMIVCGSVMPTHFNHILWWQLPLTNLPYAAIMLYGTRRLPRPAQ